MGTLDRVFHLSENKTDVKTEVMAGITTFMTMAYILAVNPDILSASGMDKGAVFTATCLASLIATVLMALLSNYPFVLSAGMGLNAYFAYTVVGSMGYSWQMALAAVFVEGLIFIALSLTNVREAIFNSIPMPLKRAVSAGIGLFIAFIGLQNCKLVVDSSTLVTVYSFSKNAETFRTEGITVLLAIIGVLITAILMVKKVKGGILWGILITWLLGIACELTGLYVPNAEMGFYSVMPDFSSGISIPSIMPTLGQMDFSAVFSLDFFVVIFAFLFVDMFDTLGTLIGVASKADMLDEQGRLPRIRGALLADAVGTSAGAALGTSTITTFVESASGVAEGGRTGLTAVVIAGLFFLSLFFAPLVALVPSFATAPVLIIVGALMMQEVGRIRFADFTVALPAFLTIVSMPLTFNIATGFGFGFVSWVGIKLLSGRFKDVNLIMCLIALCFGINFALRLH